MEFLEREIKQLEREHVILQNKETRQKLRSKQLEYNTITTQKIENAMRRFYEQGHRAGRVLAWQIRREEAQRAVHTLKSGSNTITYPK